jgi:hypothetical protein
LQTPEAAIASIRVKPAYDSQVYELSCWFLMSRDNSYAPAYELRMTDSSGNTIRSMPVAVKESTDNQGLWFRSNVFFPVPASCHSIKFVLSNPIKDCYLAMDELMLRPADALIISKDAGNRIMVNNHFFERAAR